MTGVIVSFFVSLQDKQAAIYYVTADTLAAGKASPHLEIFRRKEVEVLILTDRVDEWMLSFLTEFEGKPLLSVAKGDLDLGDLADAQELTTCAQQNPRRRLDFKCT